MGAFALGAAAVLSRQRNPLGWNAGPWLGDSRKYGLALDVGGYFKNVFTLAPSFTNTQEETDLAIDLLDQLFTRCRN